MATTMKKSKSSTSSEKTKVFKMKKIWIWNQLRKLSRLFAKWQGNRKEGIGDIDVRIEIGRVKFGLGREEDLDYGREGGAD